MLVASLQWVLKQRKHLGSWPTKMKALGFWGVYGQLVRCPLQLNSGWCFKSLGVSVMLQDNKNMRPESNSGCTQKKKYGCPMMLSKIFWKNHDKRRSQKLATEPEKILPAVTVHRRPGGFHGHPIGKTMGMSWQSPTFPAGWAAYEHPHGKI